MAVFSYNAVDSEGKSFKGFLEGDSVIQIRQKLREMNLIPMDVLPVAHKIHGNKKRWSWQLESNISSSTLSLITYEMAMLLAAGLPVEVMLATIGEQSGQSPVKRTILGVRAKVLEGHSLATSMQEFPQVFPQLYRATIAAGEKSGQLSRVLYSLANYMEKQQEVKQKIQEALIYPVLLSIVAFGIIIFLLTYAMPKIMVVFDQMNQQLPGITRFLISLSGVVTSYGLYFALALILSVIGLKQALKNKSFRYRCHQLLLKLPLIGRSLIAINTARFARTFGILFAAGVPVLDAMYAANSVIVLLPMQEVMNVAITRIGEGSPIYRALQQTNYFSPFSIQLISSGESSGRLEEILEKMSGFQERELSHVLRTLLAMFEPALIMLMGLFVLFIVLAMLLPIFDLNQLVQ